MSTDATCEHRAIDSIGFVFARRVTATSSGEEDILQALPSTYRPIGASDFCGVVAHPAATHAQPNDAESALVDFARSVLGVPDVVAVTHAKEPHSNLVWTFIRHRDKVVRKAIYARERALMAQYPDMTFDFNVVALDQSGAGALVPDDLQGRVVMYRPEE
ncbi:MAG: hypothetical protein HYV93_04625 [Candidatus Rokubacteria bacterium]|nr:hypothetical protein [Candidatus Rokubacteria bacterium]